MKSREIGVWGEESPIFKGFKLSSRHISSDIEETDSEKFGYTSRIAEIADDVTRDMVFGRFSKQDNETRGWAWRYSRDWYGNVWKVAAWAVFVEVVLVCVFVHVRGQLGFWKHQGRWRDIVIPGDNVGMRRMKRFVLVGGLQTWSKNLEEWIITIQGCMESLKK